MAATSSTASAAPIASDGDAADANASLEEVAAQGLRSIRALRAAVTNAVTQVQAGPTPSTRVSRKRRADGEVEEREESEKETAEEFVAAVKGELSGMTKAYDDLDKLANKYLRRPWAPLVSPNQAPFLTTAGLDLDCTDAFSALADEGLKWQGKNQIYANFLAHFVRQYTKLARRPQLLYHPEPKTFQDGLARLEEQLNSQQNGPSIRIRVIHTSGYHSKLHVRILAGAASDYQRFPATVMHVAIFLKGVAIEWCAVKGPDEHFQTPDGRWDFSRPSKHLLFRKLSGEAKALAIGMAVANPPQPANRLLFQFLFRLIRFRGCFLEPCKTCGKVLKDLLPPFVLGPEQRPAFFHESCRLL